MASLSPSWRINLLILLIFFKRNWKNILALVATASFLLLLQMKFNLFQNSNFLSEGLVGTYQEHDLPEEVTQLLSQGLTKFDPSGRTVPNLASSWEVNNDATIFTFKLKDSLTWSNGSPVYAQDLELNIPNTEIQFPDQKTIQFKLKEPYSPFPSLLAKPVFQKGTRLGIGPYKLARVEKSRIFITKVFLEPLSEGLPKISIRFYPNEETAFTGFSLGEVTTLLGVNYTKSLDSQITNWRRITDYTKIVTILYNTADPLLGSRSLRQSLSFISPSIAGEKEATSPIPPFSWGFESDIKDYLDNPDEAKLALGRARSAGGQDLLKKQLIVTTTPKLEGIGHQIVGTWRSLGLDVVLRTEVGVPQNFQALLITQNIPIDPDQYFLWHSTQVKTNPTKYSQARADKDLEDGRKLINEEDRRAKYVDFQRVLLEDAPATFLYFPKYNVLYLKKAEHNLNQVLPLQLSQFIN